MKNILIIISFVLTLNAIEIKQLPLNFGETRVELTRQYIKNSYGIEVLDINIIPKIIVIHHTAMDDLKESYERFKPEILTSDRKYIKKAGNLNVSAQFLVDFDGTIYSTMPETYMARHVIGLNLSSIGIENIGGNKKPLTKAQLEANIKLVRYLKEKYKTIEYLIGHYEYTKFENHPLFLEKDKNYRTIKHDPDENFMESLRANFPDLKSF
ncbi:MAG: peptidoglycan recognition family protein [Arcobacter sp.]|jgi:beta-N-acetylhexosaminidase|uniref:peptidoglycan recognition protein family protein n=1 Tax=Arcobacter sp. TaxID=1872629 RepID=UPI00258FA560|nr:peptidoglycan recognition family protein [Arcobacter sp.]MDD3008859.1 peptidoglycan recognition family protein [Arcobacter sp.]MDY3204616.1 peptidoglycan recognition family protein [Arcobacter sp.]